MSDVHPSALVRGDVDFADDVVVGPGCVIDGTLGPVVLGPRTQIVGNVYLTGPLRIGEGNTFFPFVCVGFAPQSAGDSTQTGQGVLIGDHNSFREGMTIHRAMTDDGPTTIGDHNYLMTYTHVGHDCRVSNHCTLTSGVLLAGHVTLDERVTIGGNAGVHQFCRVGRGAMLSGGMALTHDFPPFFILTGSNFAGSINMVGMRRQKFPADKIEDVRWVYKTLYRRGLPVTAAIEALRARADRPMVAEYIAFIENSKRGLCPGRPQSTRSGGV